MHSARYTALIEAVESRPAMSPGFRLGVQVTAANAQYLLDRAHQDNDLALVHGAVTLFDTADQIVRNWDTDQGEAL